MYMHRYVCIYFFYSRSLPHTNCFKTWTQINKNKNKSGDGELGVIVTATDDRGLFVKSSLSHSGKGFVVVMTDDPFFAPFFLHLVFILI